MTCGIYQIRNTVTGKSYFGSSVQVERRFGQHRRRLEAGTHHSRHLQRSWNLDGADAFEFVLILVCDPENLLMYEQALITGFKAHLGEFGYNASPTAGNTRGRRHTDEAKEKLRQANLGKKLAPEHAKAFAACGSRPKSAEHRRRIGEANKGRAVSEEAKKAISRANTGRKPSPEAVEKIRAAHLGRVMDPSAKEKLSASKAKAYVIYEGEELTIRQLAQRLGVTRWAVRHMVNRGDIQQVIKGVL